MDQRCGAVLSAIRRGLLKIQGQIFCFSGGYNQLLSSGQHKNSVPVSLIPVHRSNAARIGTRHFDSVTVYCVVYDLDTRFDHLLFFRGRGGAFGQGPSFRTDWPSIRVRVFRFVVQPVRSLVHTVRIPVVRVCSDAGFPGFGNAFLVRTFGALCRRTEERNISRRSSGRDNHGIDRLVRLLLSDRRGHGSDYDDHLGAIPGIRSSGRWRYTDHDRFPVEDGRADLSFGGSRWYLYGGVTPPLEIRVSSI